MSVIRGRPRVSGQRWKEAVRSVVWRSLESLGDGCFLTPVLFSQSLPIGEKEGLRGGGGRGKEHLREIGRR